MYDQHLRGFNVLKIKRLIKQHNPSINLQDKSISMITLVAKSQRGRGEATLVVAGSPSYPQTIVGRPRTFESNSPRTYSQVTLPVNMRSSQGRVQVELQGNIKVKEIIIQLKNKNLRNGRIDLPTQPPRRGNRRGYDRM